MKTRIVLKWVFVALLIVAQQLVFLDDVGIMAISSWLLTICKTTEFSVGILGLIQLGQEDRS